MKADEQFPVDYALLAVLRLLKENQHAGAQEVFAVCLYELWQLVRAGLPAQERSSVAAVILESYFATAGDLGKAQDTFEQALTRRVGYAAHRDAMLRTLAPGDDPATALANLILGIRERALDSLLTQTGKPT